MTNAAIFIAAKIGRQLPGLHGFPKQTAMARSISASIATIRCESPRYAHWLPR